MLQVVDFVGILIMMIGAFGLFTGLATKNIKILLYSFFVAVLGIILLAHPVWWTWYLFFQNTVATVPMWMWVVVGVWIYPNAGWQFAEYKLRVAKRWQTTHPIWLHILWPVNAHDNSVSTHPQKFCVLSDNQYKSWAAVGLIVELATKLLVILLIWLMWLATMGRFKPIHPKIWEVYRQAIN